MSVSLWGGLDIGSTTVKMVVIDEQMNIVHSEYVRHGSEIKKSVEEIVKNAFNHLGNVNLKLQITGSGGLALADQIGISFIQEVIAGTKAVERLFPETDVAIELGGEDAKITFFSTPVEQRMNGVCAGGTGAFIDQMAILLDTDATGLNQLAKNYHTIHPIASRCGVFAKTDIQPLINEGVPKEDLAASIFQAVVNQTISGLACGKSIKGKVAFLGGPLFFLSELRERFYQTLGLTDNDIIAPEFAHYMVALGCALEAVKTGPEFSLSEVLDKIQHIGELHNLETVSLEPLFRNEEAYLAFQKKHQTYKVKRSDLSTHKGPIFLGIDAGSTTTKLIAIDQEGQVLFQHYDSNKGNPLHSTCDALKNFYSQMPKEAYIGQSVVTGYGEHLLKAGLLVDEGEIETITHYRGAEYFQPGVTFVLDIGGQDMKSLKVRDGFIESIMLNEACSSGCGSFIETFAIAMGMDVKAFAKEAVYATSPVDLGTRCTVFMNSKVKQAQKEGASVADISAGIAYSVIKNALYKVIRLKNTKELGSKVVVQGGTFFNDAVLRALELTTGVEVIRPDISGLMGAFGAALIARDNFVEGTVSTILPASQLEHFNVEITNDRCKLCGNTCLLTIQTFSNGKRFVSGNRCERGLKDHTVIDRGPNFFDYKYQRLFAYKPLSVEKAYRGTIGIPRVLNIYENYPFWYRFFTDLGFRVELSKRSSKEVYSKGIDSIPSESVCYPAKMVHGHIEDLIERGVNTIFYPSIPYEIKESIDADNHYNCPIVTSYPETIRLNVPRLEKPEIKYFNPFLPLFDRDKMVKVIQRHMAKYDIDPRDIERAIDCAYGELEIYKNDLKIKAEEMIDQARKENRKIIILSGRPYHIDPEINHGIPQMISNYGMAVISEDAVVHLSELTRPLRIVDQWAYHTRLYHAAEFVSKHADMELIQLNSFGCGLDAVTIDQVQEILAKGNKTHTVIKIDEINNLGAARIRVRSLMAVMLERDKSEAESLKLNRGALTSQERLTLSAKRTKRKKSPVVSTRIEFTKAMKETHTILAPQMSPIHFKLFEAAFQSEGYNLVVLPSVDEHAIQEGLQHVHNDACYPSIITIGQIMWALKSGKYDLKNTSVVISQTGGGCRATNYIGFLRKALKDSGLDQIPVISLNAGGLEKNEGFKITPKLLNKLAIGLIYGDLFMRLIYQVRPYERQAGETMALYETWNEKATANVVSGKFLAFKKDMSLIVKDFAAIPVKSESKPKVGIVGEILVKYHPVANNHLVETLENMGAEAIVPDLTDFLLYSSYNNTIKHELLDTSIIKKYTSDAAIKFIEYYRKEMRKALEASNRFTVPSRIEEKAHSASQLISLGHQTGEGWFLTAEMIELLNSGVNNIACLQPFACLPNHIVGKGMFKALKKAYPSANIAGIDYDPGASEVNQMNRILLMITNAKDHIERQS